MVLKRPFPGLTPALWGEPERYGRDYWQKIPGVYYTGDSAHIDEDGYVWFGGPRRRDHQDRRPPHRHHRGRERVPEAPVGRRVRRHRPARRDCAAR